MPGGVLGGVVVLRIKVRASAQTIKLNNKISRIRGWSGPADKRLPKLEA